MLATMTLPGTFWFYSSVSLIGCIILYFALPETEGRTLIDIEEHFSGGRRLEDTDKKTPDSDRGFDHITVIPPSIPPAEQINKGFQDECKIPEYIRNSNAIGVKRNVNTDRRSKLSNDSNENEIEKTTTHL